LAAYSRGYRGKRRAEPRARNPRDSERTVMLNRNRLTSFRYDFKQIMEKYKVDPSLAASVLATVTAKSSNISMQAAAVYVEEQEKAGVFTKEATDEIYDLLDKFSKLR
jgi:hypothetical protein